MLVKYNGVSLPDIPSDISVDEYPYIWIRKNNYDNCYDLAVSTSIYYYNSSSGKMITTKGTEKWYRVPYNTTIDESTQWTYVDTYVGGDYFILDSYRSIMWSLFDVPLNSETATDIYYAGSTIEYPAHKYYLVRDGITLYTVADGALAEVTGDLTASLFIASGVDVIPDGSLLLTLTDPEVLCWTDGNKLPELTATVQGSTTESHDIVSDNIRVGHQSIYGIKSVETTASDGATFLLSFDGGAWMVYDTDNSAWVASDIGMNATEIVAIPTEAWSTAINSATYMQLKATLDGVDTVTQVKFNFNNEAPTSTTAESEG